MAILVKGQQKSFGVFHISQWAWTFQLIFIWKIIFLFLHGSFYSTYHCKLLWNKQFFLICMDPKLNACFTIGINTVCSWKNRKPENPRKSWNLGAKPRLTLCDNLRVNNVWVWSYPEWWQELLQEPGKIAILDLYPCFVSKGIYAFLSFFFFLIDYVSVKLTVSMLKFFN